MDMEDAIGRPVCIEHYVRRSVRDARVQRQLDTQVLCTLRWTEKNLKKSDFTRKTRQIFSSTLRLRNKPQHSPDILDLCLTVNSVREIT